MAQYVAALCDWCDLLGIEEVPAEVKRTLALDGVLRRVDLCLRCDRALEPFADLYARGQELPPEQPRRTNSRPAAKTNRPAVPEAVGQLAGGEAGAVPTARNPGAGEPGPAGVRRGGRARDTSKPSVLCPLDHPGSGGGPQRVNYAGRGSHADMVHGLRLTQIAWQDPDHILTASCTVHEQCRVHHVAFTTPAGLKNHIATTREEPHVPRDVDAVAPG